MQPEGQKYVCIWTEPETKEGRSRSQQDAQRKAESSSIFRPESHFALTPVTRGFDLIKARFAEGAEALLAEET
jgi:hypothetical protein